MHQDCNQMLKPIEGPNAWRSLLCMPCHNKDIQKQSHMCDIETAAVNSIKTKNFKSTLDLMLKLVKVNSELCVFKIKKYRILFF